MMMLTLFHEMAMPPMGCWPRVPICVGDECLWDFVELPSQLQKTGSAGGSARQFCGSLQDRGTIHLTVKKLNDAKNFDAGWMGYAWLRPPFLIWNGICAIRLALLILLPSKMKWERNRVLPRRGDDIVSFGHIFAGGCSAGYYSYKWARVLDADAFEAFKENGLYNRATARRYRMEVLEKVSEHPSILCRSFRGRDADPKAVLRRECIMKRMPGMRLIFIFFLRIFSFSLYQVGIKTSSALLKDE